MRVFKKGDRVRFVEPDIGEPSDVVIAAKYLKLRHRYRIREYHALYGPPIIRLKGKKFKDVWFNPIMFKLIS